MSVTEKRIVAQPITARTKPNGKVKSYHTDFGRPEPCWPSPNLSSIAYNILPNRLLVPSPYMNPNYPPTTVSDFTPLLQFTLKLP